MTLFSSSTPIKIILIVLLALLGIGSVIYNQYLVNEVLEKEKRSVELWAEGIQFLSVQAQQEAAANLLDAARELDRIQGVPDSLIRVIRQAENTRHSSDFVFDQIIKDSLSTSQVPAIQLDANDQLMAWKAIDTSQVDADFIREFKALREPIEITVSDGVKMITSYVYYGESDTVLLLRFFPYIQNILLALLLGIGYTTYKSIIRSEQSNLWVGMAKEAAHQLGTPISSLFGWVQLLKDEYRYEESASNIAKEIENDIERLQRVAERFGKIGSEPELTPSKIQPMLEQVVNYMERRLPRIGKKVEVRRSLEANSMVNLNSELFQWAIENMVKNSMDAIRDESKEAYVSISSREEGDKVIIDIEDSGSGIPLANIKNVFKPGFSTKKRGWGLGLSLTKRIIEEYHSGSILILRSELDEGTTMRITLDVAEQAN